MKIRKLFTPQQKDKLEHFFIANAHPDTSEVREIARCVCLQYIQVQKWFQNRRRREREYDIIKVKFL